MLQMMNYLELLILQFFFTKLMLFLITHLSITSKHQVYHGCITFHLVLQLLVTYLQQLILKVILSKFLFKNHNLLVQQAFMKIHFFKRLNEFSFIVIFFLFQEFPSYNNLDLEEVNNMLLQQNIFLHCNLFLYLFKKQEH